MSQLPPPVEITVLDDDGNPHGYLIGLHPAAEGQKVVCQLLGLAAGPLAELLAAGARSGGDALGADVDLQAVGRQVGALLLGDAPPRLIRELLGYTSRDGRALRGDHEFNVAYTGNYGELLAALKEVVQANRFLPLSRISSALPGAKATRS